MLEGKYTDAYLKEAGKDAPKFTQEDLKIIGSPLDFVGINVYYAKAFVLASDQVPGWPKEIYITENGCSCEDVLAKDGKVYDTDRVMFLRAYLTQLQRATAEGQALTSRA